MNKPPRDSGKEQQLLRHARRESWLLLAVWLVALIWSVTAGYLMGYERDPATISLILGMPDWVFWSVVFPWGLCLAFSVWFCFGIMADDDLGQDPEDQEAGHA
jgi:hypothetical protein